MFSHSPGGGTVWNVLERCRHPLATLFVIALAVRLIIMPLVSHDFDIYHWALVIENIQTGDELYGLDGYYYTPTWGYVLAFFSLIQDTFLWVDTFGLRVTELLPIEDLVFDDHMATATTIAFNMSLKVPMVIIDFLVAWLLYTLLMDMTGSRRKSLAGAALWLFCPVVIFMSSVQIQFDVLSALFMLLVVILLRKDRCFLAGMVLTTAILLKFFPIPGQRFRPAQADVLIPGNPGAVLHLGLYRHIQGVVLQPPAVFLPEFFDGRFLFSPGKGFSEQHKPGVPQGFIIHLFRVVSPVVFQAFLFCQKPLVTEAIQIQKIGVPRKGGKALVGAVPIAGGANGQHLPVGLARLLQKIYKFISAPAQRPNPIGRGQAAHRQ